MKIGISRNGHEVTITVQVFIPYYEERVWTFSWNAGNAVYAGLLTQRFADALSQHVRAIRRNAYERGWEDHKKRRPKAEYFSGCINDE